MQIQNTVNIPATRYIELLEIEIRMLKQPARQITGGCNLNEITKRIRKTGITSKQWAEKQGFKANAVRTVVCGHWKSEAITNALIRDGFIEA